MKLFKFEMSKLWRQKKFLLLFIIVLIGISGIYLQNHFQQQKMGDRALENIREYIDETDGLYAKLNALSRENMLDEHQEKQYESSNAMATAFFQWKSAIYNENWHEIPQLENDFLTNLQAFENAGGHFEKLQGMEKEIAIAKSEWLLLHNLSYEDEAHPVSPALILKESTGILLGVVGILILLLFFGNTITVEKEQHTWSTLKTQPIKKWKLIAAKYATALVAILALLVMVVVIGLVIPLIFSGYSINLYYPQILMTDDSFTVISTSHYLLRGFVLFICASIVAFGLIFLVSTWLKNSFSALIITGFIILMGFFATDLFTPLQTALNPFYYFHFPQIMAELPKQTNFLYPLAAILWGFVFVSLAVFLPEKELTLFGSAELKKPFKGGKKKRQSRPLWNVILFEWRKMRRNGLLKQLYIILILAVILGYFAITELTDQRETVYVDTLQERKELYENVWIPDLERVVASGDEFGKEYHEKLLRYERGTLEKNKAALKAFEKQDWTSFYDYQNHVILQKDSLREIERSVGGFSSGGGDPLSNFTYDVSVAEKKWLKDKDIQPVFSGEYLLTIHDNWQDFQDLQKIRVEENSRLDNSGLYSLYIYFDKYFYFIPLLLFLFLLGTGFANEKGKKKTLQLLKTQPVAEKKIFLGKGIYASTTALISSVGLFAFVTLVATVFNRFGDWHYPILRYDSRRFVEAINFEYDGIRTIDGAGHFITLGNYLMGSIGLFLCVLMFVISLSIFLSLFFKSTFGVFMTTILIGVIGYAGSRELLTDQAHLSPFTYFDISKITNGQISALINNPSITAQSGYLVLLGATLILFLIGYFFLNLKNRGAK